MPQLQQYQMHVIDERPPKPIDHSDFRPTNTYKVLTEEIKQNIKRKKDFLMNG